MAQEMQTRGATGPEGFTLDEEGYRRFCADALFYDMCALVESKPQLTAEEAAVHLSNAEYLRHAQGAETLILRRFSAGYVASESGEGQFSSRVVKAASRLVINAGLMGKININRR